MINVTSIPLFENLIQYKFSNIYYDFHNDYYCQKLFYCDNELFIYLNHIEENKNVIFNFINVNIDRRGYFYLEFYEGQKIEFWAEYIVLSEE